MIHIVVALPPMVLSLVMAFLQFKSVAIHARDYTDSVEDYRQYPVPAYFEDLKRSKLKYLKSGTLCLFYVSLAAVFFYYLITL